MIHPIFRLIASQPQLIADHAQAYSELVAQEIDAFGDHWRSRLLFGTLGLVAAAVTLTLVGVAVMLWAVTPDNEMRAPWALIIMPALPALLTFWCIVRMRAAAAGLRSSALREQLAADAAMLREVSAP